MKQSKNQIRKRNILHNTSGVTLVELIVTFMLVAMLMISVTRVISASLNIYQRVKEKSYGYQVSDMLIEKISGELSAAQKRYMTKPGEEEAENPADIFFRITEGANQKDSVTFFDKKNRKVKLEVDSEGFLNLDYLDSDNAGEEEWRLNQKAYMGYRIVEFRVEQPAGYEKNILKVTLKIEHEQYGACTQTEYIECYNLS